MTGPYDDTSYLDERIEYVTLALAFFSGLDDAMANKPNTEKEAIWAAVNKREFCKQCRRVASGTLYLLKEWKEHYGDGEETVAP